MSVSARSVTWIGSMEIRMTEEQLTELEALVNEPPPASTYHYANKLFALGERAKTAVPELIAEVRRLQTLVQKAYAQGYAHGDHGCLFGLVVEEVGCDCWPEIPASRPCPVCGL